METVLRVTERATGKRVEIPTASLAEQNEYLQSLYAVGSSLYSEAGIYFLEPKQVVQIKDAASEPPKTETETVRPVQPKKFQTPMKKILLSIVAAAFTLPIFAQSAFVPISASLMPATLATTVVSNLAADCVFEVERQANVAIQLSFNQSAASTSNVVYTFSRGIDRTTWDTNNMIDITIASSGTRRIEWVTNISVGPVRYLRLHRISNATALTTLTNFGIQYSIKANAP